MNDFLNLLPARDRAALVRLAEAARVPPEIMIVQVCCAYLRLARDAPGALPSDPLSRRAALAAGGQS